MYNNQKKSPPFNDKRCAVVIPVYNHGDTILSVIRDALKLNLPIFIVNDGSTDTTSRILENTKGVTCLCHKINLGKGAALLTGFKAAAKNFDWAITIDADGQHHVKDAIKLITAIPCDKRSIIIGVRKGMNNGMHVPWTSRFGRSFSNFWVWVSGGGRLSDSQSGFRIYPLPETIDLKVVSKRFQFEVEILAKAGWKKIPIIEVPVMVTYLSKQKRISHFRPFVDFLRNGATFTRLIFQRIFIPSFLRRRL